MDENLPPQKPYITEKNKQPFLIDPFGKSYALPTGDAVQKAEKLCTDYQNGTNTDFSEALMGLAKELSKPTDAYWYLEDTAIGVFDSIDEAIEALNDAEDPVKILSETKDGIIEQFIPKNEIRISMDD